MAVDRHQTAKTPTPDALAHRKRVALLSGLAALVVFLIFPVLTAFTPLLNGVLGHVGIAYLGGFGEMVLAMLGVFAYCHWANRADDRR